MQQYWLNYQHLRYFATIATAGGVAKAAAKLRLGQSTLSTQLSRFEEHLGIELFERRKQRLHLTEAGRITLQYAREIFKLGDELVDALQDRRQAHRISVQIGALDSIPKSVIVQLVAAAQKKQPCAVSVVEGSAEELLRALEAHEIDLAVFSHQPFTSGRKAARLAGRSPVEILGAKAFARLAKGFPESLAGQPFVMPASPARLRHGLDLALKVRGIPVDVVLEAQDFGLLALLAAQGHGLIPAPASVAKDLERQHDLVRLGAFPDVLDELWLVASERRVENPVAAHLLREFGAV